MQKKIKYKSNHNIIYSCKYHIIWCPKYRRKVLVGKVEKRLKEIIIQVANELNVEIIEMETDKDHIHILADIDPCYCSLILTTNCSLNLSNSYC